MASRPRHTRNIPARARERNLRQRSLRAREVMEVALTTLQQVLTLKMAAHPHYSPESVLAVLLQAADGSSVEDATHSLEGAPHPNTVRLTLQAWRSPVTSSMSPIGARRRRGRRILSGAHAPCVALGASLSMPLCMSSRRGNALPSPCVPAANRKGWLWR